MNKEIALHNFWSSFGVPAYDESTVPEDAALPRITYNVITDGFNSSVSLKASLWSRSKSWVQVTELKDEVEEALGHGGKTVPYDGGIMWIKKGNSFAQRMSDPDDSIRRILLTLDAEFISEV